MTALILTNVISINKIYRALNLRVRLFSRLFAIELCCDHWIHSSNCTLTFKYEAFYIHFDVTFRQ